MLIRTLCAAALLAGLVACSKGTPAAAPQTEPPTATPGVQASGDFQLAGSVDHAFQGVGPPVQVALAGVSLTPSPAAGSGPTGASGGTIGGAPTQQGVMRITLDNVSTTLHDQCGANTGDKVNVFWLTDTQFDPSLLGGTTMETSLEGRKIGVAGSIFAAGAQPSSNFGLPSPSASPLATAGALNTNCTLVADRVTSGTEVLPTVRPRTRTGTATTAPATPRATVRPTATVRATATPTPRHTASPTPAPTPSATLPGP
jgi:hypothetical protein